jgi:hypothetical protein
MARMPPVRHWRSYGTEQLPTPVEARELFDRSMRSDEGRETSTGVAMADFTKTIAAAKQRVAKAGARAFIARMEAIDSILEGADAHNIMLLVANALTNIAPLCCDKHLDEFKEELLRMLDHCVAVALENEEQDAAEADDGDAPPLVH